MRRINLKMNTGFTRTLTLKKDKVKLVSGFTLVELILAVGIAATVLSLISFFMAHVLEAQVKHQSIAEVEEQGAYVMSVITEAIRNADTITVPTTGGSGDTLNLHMSSAPQDPTVFTITSGFITMSEAGGPAIQLTNSKVVASALWFQNLSRSGTPGVVRVSFTLARFDSSGRYEYNFNKTFYGGSSLR